MQKDDRFYTFLLTHSSKNKIYIRRVEISKKFVTNFAASLIFSIGLLSIGVLGLLKSDSLILDKVGAQILSQSENTSQQVSFSQNNNPNYTEASSINYDRPRPNNSGGPLTLSNFESEAEE